MNFIQYLIFPRGVPLINYEMKRFFFFPVRTISDIMKYTKEMF